MGKIFNRKCLISFFFVVSIVFNVYYVLHNNDLKKLTLEKPNLESMVSSSFEVYADDKSVDYVTLYEKAIAAVNSSWVGPNSSVIFTMKNDKNITEKFYSYSNSRKDKSSYKLNKIYNYDSAFENVFTTNYLNKNVLCKVGNNKVIYDDSKSTNCSNYIIEYNDNYYLNDGGRGYNGDYLYTTLEFVTATDTRVIMNAIATYYDDSCYIDDTIEINKLCTTRRTTTTMFTVIKENGEWQVSEVTSPY